MSKIQQFELPSFHSDPRGLMFAPIIIQTLTTKDCKNEYAEEPRIYEDLISKNEK